MIHNYKKFILSLLFGAWTVTILAQNPLPNYTLPDIETGATKAYVARDFVKLEPGFDYAASSNTTFNAKIDAGLLFPPTSNTYAMPNGTITTDPTQGGIVGSIAGSTSVTPTGAATYQIPIELPAGINGMQPGLSVVYNSQGGAGALGIGWDVAGCSAITRGNKNIYFDARNINIKFDNSDPLYLDGQRLILLSGTHLTAGAVYGTEIENYSRVTIYENTNTLKSIYFVVTSIDGKTLEYGKTDDSQVKDAGNYPFSVLAWKLNKVTDTYTNSMTYTYSDYGQYLSQINYAGQSVVFGYVTNNVNPRKSYIQSFLISQSKLLSTVSVQSNGTLLKTYSFGYLPDNRLNTVSETAADNTKINSTTINWGADTNIQFNQIGTITDNTLSLQSAGRTSIDYADINGDGYPDRIERWIGNGSQAGHIKVYFYDSVNKTFANAKTAILNVPYRDYNTYHQQFIYADINNDGKAEIIYTNFGALYAYSYNSTTNTFFTCFRDNIDGHNTDPIISGSSATKMVKLVTADINKDGYADIVIAWYNKGTDGRRGYAVYYGSQDGLNPNPDSNWANPSSTLNYLEIGDFNADGKLDIVGLPGSWSYNESLIDDSNFTFVTDGNWDINGISGTKDQVLDINGDGLSDLIAMCPTNGIWRSSTNTGGIFYQPNLKNEPFNGPNVHFIDINGDGLVDAVSYTNNYDCTPVPNPNYDGYNPSEPQYNCPPYYVNTTWSIYLNTGNGNFATPITYTSNNAEITDPNLITIADINGDGIPDLIITQGSTMFALTMPNANRRNLVSSITNGMNQTESFTYKNFSNYDAYTDNEFIAKIRPLRGPILLVDTYTQTDGSVTSYSYTSPKYHTEGKGFLGFTTVTAINTQKNAKVISNYDFNQTYYFSVLTSQHISTVSGTDNVSVSSLTNDVKLIENSNERYIPIITKQISTDVLKGISQTSTTDYTNYPTSLTQSSTTGDLTTSTVTTFTGPSGKTPYLPATVITTRTQTGNPNIRETDYAYTFNGSGNPYQITGKTETTDPGDVNSSLTTFSNYDTWGHPQNVTVTANGIARSSSVSYTSSRSSSGRFLQSKTNTLLNETTNYTWNETTGLLDSETDPRGHTTTYSYDGFGQLKETVYPDGNRKTSAMQWAGTGGVSGAVYYSYSQASGGVPLTVWYDALGREMQSDTYGLNNKKISVSTEYYTSGANKGRLYRVSEPYFEEDAGNKIWAKTYATYDDYGRPTLANTIMGDVSTQFNGLTTSITTPEGTTEATLNSAGQTVTSNVNGKAVNYSYYSSGLTKTSTPEGGQSISMVYNLQGERIQLKDPDGGFTRSEYDGFGEQTLEVQRVHLSGDSIRTNHTYKTDGRLESINRNGEITTYSYDTSFKGRVTVIELKDKNNNVQNRQTFTYDPTNITDRITNVKEEIADNNGNLRVYNTGKEYDALGRIKKEIYPSGYYTVNTYDGYGNMTETTDGVGRSIWKAIDENAKGQLLHVSKGSKTTTYDYWDNGLTKEIKADNVVDMYYEYESQSHNLHSREDKLSNQNDQKETFGYDGMNRLISWTVNRNGTDTPYTMSYDATSSNITSKSDLGGFAMTYGGNRADGSPIGPHALATISGVPASPFPTADLNVTYTDFKKIATLSEGNKFYRLTYGTDDERRKSEYYANGLSQGNATLTRYYAGSYEEEINSLGNVRKIHYLSGAILIQNSNSTTDSLLYTYSDYQGSLIALADVNGNVVEKYAYDPWGARRNPTDWTQKDIRTKWIVNRGYTGHEHLDAFGIINMNGRVYDPATGMFFSPDPTLTDAGNWLDYNRYSYCLNNPFRYTDPSGFSWWAENWQPVVTTAASIVVGLGVGLIAGPMGLVAAGMMGGAAGGFTSGTLGTALYGGSFNQCLGAGMQGAFIGGIAGMAGGGAAEWMTSVIGSSVGGFAAGAAIGATGGAVGGFVGGSLGGWMNGVSFDDGLLAGLTGAGIGALAGGLMGGMIKGVDAAVHGDNFWDGVHIFDLSEGVGATNIRAEVLKLESIKGVYSGRDYHGVRVYESNLLGDSKISGGITFPERGIVVGDGAYRNGNLFPHLMQHEFGHILQYRLIQAILGDQVGLDRYYNIIGVNSFASATKQTLSFGSYNHNEFWTETWANYLSQQYMGNSYLLDLENYPVKNIDSQMFQRLFGK